MLSKEHYLVFSVFILFIVVFITSPTYTGLVVNNETNQTEGLNATYIPSPLLRIELASKSFDQGRLITGLVKLNLSGRISQNDTITLSTNNQSSERKLIDLVRSLNIPYRELQTIYKGENPLPIKQLTFNSAGSQLVGIKVRSKSNVVGFKLDVEGKAFNSQFPKFPRIDIGSKELYNDWEYYGNLESYDTVPAAASGLELVNTEEQIIITNSPKTFYCEKINLPESRAFKLSARYQKTSSLGDLRLKVIASDFSEIPTAECDLPENTDLNWHDCDAVLDRPLKGEKLICLYSDKDQAINGLAKLSIDPSTTSGNPNSDGYVCNQDFDCDLTPPTDYYIRAYPGIYPKILSTKETFQNWSTSPEIEKLSFNRHLGICEPFDFSKTFCMTPLKIISDSSGIIELSGLELRYSKDGSTFAPVTELNDLTYTESSIEIVNGAELQIPIAAFNLVAPSTKTAILTVETSTGLTAEKNYDVNLIESEVTLEPIPATLNKISIAKNTLTRLKSDKITAALGLLGKINSVFDELIKIESSINIIQASTNLTQIEKEIQVLATNIQLDEILKQVPKDYNIKASFKFSPPRMSFEELSSEIPIKQDNNYKIAVLNLQDQVKIDAEAKVFDILYSDGAKQIATTITKTITAAEKLINVEIIEKIPKSTAKSVSEIGFDTPATTLKDDPVVKFIIGEISPNSPGKITYAVYKDVLSDVEETSTLYLPSQVSNDLIGIDCGNNFCNFMEDYTSCPEDCLCGNNVCDIGEELSCPSDCKEFPLGLVTSLIVIALLAAGGGYYYLVIYKDPIKQKEFMERLRRIPVINVFFEERKLFKNPQELQSLKTFIRDAASKRYSRQQIEQMLLKKGWKEEQINEAFKP